MPRNSMLQTKWLVKSNCLFAFANMNRNWVGDHQKFLYTVRSKSHHKAIPWFVENLHLFNAAIAKFQAEFWVFNRSYGMSLVEMQSNAIQTSSMHLFKCPIPNASFVNNIHGNVRRRCHFIVKSINNDLNLML